MVVVSGTFQFPAGTRQKVLDAMEAVVAQTLQEQGCMCYRFYTDMSDENTYRVFEEWESEQHLAAHGKSAHLNAFRSALGELGMLSRDVKMYHVSGSKQL